MKIFINGHDNIGWSIDNDYMNIAKSLYRLNLSATNFFWQADIVHNVWWNQLLSPRNYLLRYKRNIIATASNFISLDDPSYELMDDFIKINPFIKAWISPSYKQKVQFDKKNILSYYLPFFVDTNIFRHIPWAKQELIRFLEIPAEFFSDRIIIGSFQRDSLGSDLSIPKWQKGPELLMELLDELPKDKFLLFLAGPRRHYLINECKKRNIPYYYFGIETVEDDIALNSISLDLMPYLYNLIDIYLVTSKTEGGPKAVLESILCKTFIMSTNVGLALDFVDKDFVFNNIDDFKRELNNYVTNFTSFHSHKNTLTSFCLERAQKVLDYSAMDRRLMNIYMDLSKSRLS